MRTKEQPDMEIDWESFTGVDRTKAAKKQTSEEDVSQNVDAKIHFIIIVLWLLYPYIIQQECVHVKPGVIMGKSLFDKNKKINNEKLILH